MLSVPKFPALLAVFTIVSFASRAQTSGPSVPASVEAAGVAQTSSAAHPAEATHPADVTDPSTDPTPGSPETVSQVRIVRLSEIRGAAQLDRNLGRGFEPAFANIPIVQGSKLRTEAGLAEVEFEDNSTLRLTPDSAVEFLELGRSANGQTITACKVLKGMVYVTLGSHPGVFSVRAGASTLTPSPKSHLRLDMGDASTTVAVMEGSVDVNGASGSTTVPKKRTLTLTSGEQPVMVAASKIEPTSYDEWDKQGNAYQSRYANSAFAGSGMGFGSSDLNYYGGFSDLAGCGSVWRPYFANAAWDPYGAGTWALYPGAGYSFISPYPWGWLPFHSGAWQQCGAAGWGWNPAGYSGAWRGLNNVASLPNGGKIVHAPVKPPVGHASMVSVGTGSAETSRLTSPGTFTFKQNSAGLGVPRDVFGKLAHTSQAVERHGSANTEAAVGFMAAPATGRQGSPSGAIAVITRPSAANSYSQAGSPEMGNSGLSRSTSSASTSASVHSVSSSSMGGGSHSGGAGGGGHK